jgi:hypothetical protein
MKLIVYRGGVVTFRIPAHWREEYSDIEGGTFYEDRADSGTLRLTIITMTTPKQFQSGSAMNVLQVVENGLKNEGVKGTTKARNDGNAVFKYVQAASEQGMRLTIFNWIVVNPLPPHHARVATFSYTILAEQRNQSRVQRDLELLEAEIEAATFSSELGIVFD